MKVWHLEPWPDVNKTNQFLLAALAPSGVLSAREDSFHFAETFSFPGAQLSTGLFPVTKRRPQCLPEGWARWIIRNFWWVADFVSSHLSCVSKQRHCSFPTSRQTDWESSTAWATQLTNSITHILSLHPYVGSILRKHVIYWEETWNRCRESIGALPCTTWGQDKEVLLELVGLLGKQRSFCGGLSMSVISPGKGHVCVRYLFSLL